MLFIGYINLDLYDFFFILHRTSVIFFIFHKRCLVMQSNPYIISVLWFFLKIASYNLYYFVLFECNMRINQNIWGKWAVQFAMFISIIFICHRILFYFYNFILPSYTNMVLSVKIFSLCLLFKYINCGRILWWYIKDISQNKIIGCSKKN